MSSTCSLAVTRTDGYTEFSHWRNGRVAPAVAGGGCDLGVVTVSGVHVDKVNPPKDTEDIDVYEIFCQSRR